MKLEPCRGFNWTAVSWGGPDEVVTGECSYCDAPLGDEEMPLILWNAEGWAARFCSVCQQRWWGIKSVDSQGDRDRSGASPARGRQSQTDRPPFDQD